MQTGRAGEGAGGRDGTQTKLELGSGRTERGEENILRRKGFKEGGKSMLFILKKKKKENVSNKKKKKKKKKKTNTKKKKKHKKRKKKKRATEESHSSRTHCAPNWKGEE